MRIINITPESKKTPHHSKSKFAFWHFIKKYHLIAWTFRLSALGVLALAMLFVYFWITLPTPQELMTRTVPESTKIFDRNGELLYEVHGEYKRTLVELENISPYLQNATVAIEDKDFYKHGGISFWAIFRTIVEDIYKRRAAGGSTITQQFVKNAALTRDKSLYRKLKEVFLAVQIDAKYSKTDILKFYLNEIPYGRNAYGIEAGSQAYFSKSAKDLTLAESAYLAALPQAPSFYNPQNNRKILDARQKTVLRAMRDQGYISQEEHEKALQENVIFQQAKTALIAPHFVLYVQDYLSSKFGAKSLEEGGLKVYTTLDINLQKSAEAIVKESVEKNSKKYNANNASLVAIDPKTGQILAMVGSKSYFTKSEPEGCTPGKNCTFEPHVNVAVSERQPGSSFKPFVYLTAFTKEHGYSPASMLMDVNTNFGTFNGKAYEPKNYNGQSYGPVSMRKALSGSLNISAVKTLSLVGVEKATQVARNLGITSPLQNCGLSLVLGGCEVRLIDHTASFGVIANLGKKNEKTSILKIEDKSGKIIEEYKQKEEEVIDPQAAYQLISVMTDNEARSYIFGENSPLNFGDKQVACKTGTTNNWHDGWTMCFTPNLSVGVWSGNNNGELLKKGADGVYVAAPIVKKFITESFKTRPAENFERPKGITEVEVDSVSGLLPTQFTPTTKTEIFADYNSPKSYDPVHIGVKINTQTGEPATELTPPDQISTKVYTVFHSERKDNPNWENAVISWANQNGYAYPPGSGIIVPPEGGINNDSNDFDINIESPQDNNLIMSLPFNLKLTTTPGINLSRIDLFFDGKLTDSFENTSDINVSRKLADGPHTLVVKAVDSTGNTGTTSVKLIYALNTKLYITQPQNGDTLTFPTNLYAESLEDLGPITFYSQKANETPKILGTATSVNNGQTYRYHLEIADTPESGTIKIFAKTQNNQTSNRLTVTFP